MLQNRQYRRNSQHDSTFFWRKLSFITDIAELKLYVGICDRLLVYIEIFRILDRSSTTEHVSRRLDHILQLKCLGFGVNGHYCINITVHFLSNYKVYLRPNKDRIVSWFKWCSTNRSKILNELQAHTFSNIRNDDLCKIEYSISNTR